MKGNKIVWMRGDERLLITPCSFRQQNHSVVTSHHLPQSWYVRFTRLFLLMMLEVHKRRKKWFMKIRILFLKNYYKFEPYVKMWFYIFCRNQQSNSLLGYNNSAIILAVRMIHHSIPSLPVHYCDLPCLFHVVNLLG